MTCRCINVTLGFLVLVGISACARDETGYYKDSPASRYSSECAKRYKRARTFADSIAVNNSIIADGLFSSRHCAEYYPLNG